VSTPKYTRTDSATARPSASVRATPNLPIASSSLAFDRWREGERFGGGEIPLGDLGGGRQIGVNLVELEPGRQSCPLHYHVREEEHFYVLEGRCLARVDDVRHAMGPGDYVCFPAGTGVAHCFENPYAEPCKLLAIGSRLDDEIAVYPDSKKVKLRALGKIVPWPEQTLDYWAGERADEPLPGTAAARERERAQKAAQAEEQEKEIDDEIAAMKKKLGLES
jgi:uncharacterized cupin superfamily protein